VTKLLDAEERIYPHKTDPRVYDEHVARYVFASKFVSGKRVLDMACGSGYGSKILYDAGAVTVHGYDLSKEAIEFANQNYLNESIKFQIMDAIKITFPANLFDCVVSFETIEHVSDYEEAIKGFHRILKDDGIIIISTPNKEIVSRGRDKPMNPFHIKEFTRDEFLELMNKYFINVELFSQKLQIDIKIRKKILRKIILTIIHLDFLKLHTKLKRRAVYDSLSSSIDNISRDYTPVPYENNQRPLVFIVKGTKREFLTK